MQFRHGVAIPKTISDMCATREQVIVVLSTAYSAIKTAQQMMKETCSISYGLPPDAVPRDTLKDAIKGIDRYLWRESFERTGFMQLLDADSKNKLEKSIQHEPPEFTEANIQTTFLELFQQSDRMFSDGIVNVFRCLSGDYKTNDVFKIGTKIIIGYMIQHSYGGGMEFRYGFGEDRINDIDRVFKVLDGKKHNARELSTVMNEAFKKKLPYEDDYYFARAFKNGNLHLTLKRCDLVDKINVIIAKHYGEGKLA